MILKGLLAPAVKTLGTGLLSGCLLWQIAVRVGPQTNVVVVHVLEVPAVVLIDGRPYPVSNPWESPLICELRQGWHDLQMLRDDRVVYQERFRVTLGTDITLTARPPRPSTNRHQD